MIAYRATLDVPGEPAQFLAKLLLAEHRRRGTPRGSKALTCFWQTVLGLRWFRGHGTLKAPELHQALERVRPAHPALAHPPAHHRQPQPIGNITRAALALTHLEHGYIT